MTNNKKAVRYVLMKFTDDEYRKIETASKESGRSKAAECKLRVIDHLTRFEDDGFKRKGDERK
ncbi:TraY domain-containing protein [Providencia sp. wls1919]|nr:TraY domain-containing protein [Providencia sp. wls1919]